MVKWNFLKKVLNYYGFGYNFKRWITILYNDSESCVANNGYTSSFFKLSRGIRQGCPISALLFLLVVEINAIVLRKTNTVSGLKVGQTEIKLCQLADDMTLFLTSVESVKIAIELFEEFYRYSGLKLNKSKTEAFIIEGDNVKIHRDNTIGIRWLTKPFKTLGMWYSLDPNKTYKLNFTEKINIIQSTLKTWQPRCLTLKGKITVLKSLIVPHILQLASVLPFNHSTLADLDAMFFNFVWSNRLHTISKNVLIQPVELGGLKMISTKCIVESAKVMWIKRFCNSVEAKWKTLALNLMGIEKNMLNRKQLLKDIIKKNKN